MVFFLGVQIAILRSVSPPIPRAGVPEAAPGRLHMPCSWLRPPSLSSPGTNPRVLNAFLVLAAARNYKLSRRKSQNQAKWLPFPLGVRNRPPTPQRGQLAPILPTIEKLLFFSFCSTVKIRHGTEMTLQTGPGLYMTEGSSRPLSEHQVWREPRSAQHRQQCGSIILRFFS